MAGRLTTHALDVVSGAGAAGLSVALRRRGGDVLVTATLDANGRAVLLNGGLAQGGYALTFAAAEYHRGAGVALADPPFLDEIVIVFGVSDPDAHYHVPLVFSPYSYSTYRGT
jgi:5-hydroxyisourate hydrolase